MFFIELEIFFLFKIKFSSFNNLIQSHLLVASACILPKVFEYWMFQPNLFPFNEHNYRRSTCRVQEMDLCSSDFLESHLPTLLPRLHRCSRVWKCIHAWVFLRSSQLALTWRQVSKTTTMGDRRDVPFIQFIFSLSLKYKKGKKKKKDLSYYWNWKITIFLGLAAKVKADTVRNCCMMHA